MTRRAGYNQIRHLGTYIVLALVLSACTEHSDAPLFGTSDDEDSATEFSALRPLRQIIVLEPKANAADVIRQHGLEPIHTYTHVLNGFATSIADAARSGLLRDNRIVRVVPDEVITHVGDQKNPVWNLDRIDQPLLPLDQLYSYSYTGAGVTAFIFDSGIRFDHQEFGGRAVPGFDAFGGNGVDCNGHGTHVTGILGGSTYGVAKEVRLVAVRMLDCAGRGTLAGLLAGIDWVLANHDGGPALANMSLGGYVNEEVNAAVRKLVSGGIQVSAAAGNDGTDACQRSPASTAEIVTVAATNSSDTRTSWSNWGNCVDVFSPGEAILAATYESSTMAGYKTGTSMAAPHVGGVMALFLQETPSLTPMQLEEMVVRYATQNVVQQALSERAHLVRSLRSDAAPPPSEPPPPASTPSAPSGLSLKLVALNRVDLKWSDTSANESGFIVERRTGSGEWVGLMQVGANTTSYVDNSVLRDATYTYQIVAVNAAGVSAPSNEQTVKVSCSTKGKSLNCK